MPKQGHTKKDYKKAWREKQHEQNRFNKVLNEYLKLKYSGIYQECHEFFKILNERNPKTRDLTKTATFSKWARTQHTEDSDDEAIKLFTYRVNSQGEVSTTVTIESISRDGDDQGDNAQQQDQDNQDYERGNQQQDRDQANNEASNIIDRIVNELELGNQQQDHDQANNEASNIIDRIVNELELDQDLQNMLGQPQHDLPDDEGIGLNLEDEITDPFDFALEVDF